MPHLRVAGNHCGAKSLIQSIILLPWRQFGRNTMTGSGRTRAVCVLTLLVFLVPHLFGQTPPVLRVDEQQIKFRLDSHPVLEIPIANTSDKALVGNFRLELLDTNNKVESFVTGAFQEKPGTTVEKVEWPLDYLVATSPSSLGWRRLHYSFLPRSELGVAPTEGFVQLSRALVGVFEVRMT